MAKGIHGVGNQILGHIGQDIFKHYLYGRIERFNLPSSKGIFSCHAASKSNRDDSGLPCIRQYVRSGINSVAKYAVYLGNFRNTEKLIGIKLPVKHGGGCVIEINESHIRISVSAGCKCKKVIEHI